MNKPDGGLAFPPLEFTKDAPLGHLITGLSKRELLAGMAMQGLTAHLFRTQLIQNADDVAKLAVGCADALLKALEADHAE